MDYSKLLLREKFSKGLPHAVGQHVVGRSEAIYLATVCLLSKQHMLLIGTPGTGKSMLVREICNCFEMKRSEFFQILLTRFTAPEEVLGPPMLTELKKDKFIRQINGYMPTARIAFLDEIFKANSSILNALLMMINERLFRQGTDLITVPLLSCFGASNRFSDDLDLNAFSSRFLIRLIFSNLSGGDFDRMITLLDNPNPATFPFINMKELETAQAEVAKVVVSNSTLSAMGELRDKLAAEGFGLSDRTFALLIKALKAIAWLDNRTQVEKDDLLVVEHIAWNSPEDKPKVAKIVTQNIKPVLFEINSLLNEAKDEFNIAMRSKNSEDGMRANKILKEKVIELTDLAKKHANSTDMKRKFRDAIVKVNDMNREVVKECLGLSL